MNKLLAIASEVNSIEQIILDNDGELTETLDNYLKITEENLVYKVDNYSHLIDRLERGVEFFKMKQEEALKARRIYESTIDNMKLTLRHVLESMNRTELRGNDYVYKLSRGKPKVKISDESGLPMEYCREKIVLEPDKEKIFNALENGIEIDGCILEETTTLRKYQNRN